MKPEASEVKVGFDSDDPDKSKIFLFDRFRPLHYTTPRYDTENVTHVVIVAINSTVNYNAGVVQIVTNQTAAMGPAEVSLTHPTTNWDV